MKSSKIFEIFEEQKGSRKYIYTKALVPGKLFDETRKFEKFSVDRKLQTLYTRTKKDGTTTYREIDPSHSKLAAAIIKGATNVGIRKNDVILYLGASHGYTPSFISDMVGKDGFVFALDFAPRVVRDLYFLCEKRSNMTPLMEDANHPENYKNKIIQVDVVYQDIAQKNQVEIFLKNTKLFLKKGGYALLALKSRSVDVTKKPKVIFKDVLKELESHLKVIDYRILDPFEKDHAFFICKNG